MGLKSFLRSSKLTGGVYKKLAKKKADYINNKKRKKIQEYGMKTIESLQAFLESQNIRFFFDMGTLLGIVRENKLLGHDLDIDVGCLVSSKQEKEIVSSILLKNNCKLRFKYETEELGVVEESYILNGIKFDMNYYYVENDKSVCYLMYKDSDIKYDGYDLSVVKLTCDKIENVELYKWGNISINVPASPEKYLSQRYGENWRIPDKNYIYWKGPSTTLTDLKGYHTKY